MLLVPNAQEFLADPCIFIASIIEALIFTLPDTLSLSSELNPLRLIQARCIFGLESPTTANSRMQRPITTFDCRYLTQTLLRALLHSNLNGFCGTPGGH